MGILVGIVDGSKVLIKDGEADGIIVELGFGVGDIVGDIDGYNEGP